MSLCENGFEMSKSVNRWEACFEEATKYKVTSYVAADKKFDEKYTGDSYSKWQNQRWKLYNGYIRWYGSGKGAGTESKMAIEIMEKIIELGFDDVIAINTINSIVGIKFDEEESLQL